MELAVKSCLRRYGVQETTLLLACSGGADSIALARALQSLEKPLGLRVHWVYVDHGLRSDSAENGRWVLEQATSTGASARVVKVSVDERGSLEAAARDARYQALAEVAEEEGAAWVLTAHTEDDQAETVLMRAVRGTGVSGLAGIPERRDRYLRPLLGVSRQKVLAYLQGLGQPFWNDTMNADDRFTRVRFRRRWLPELEAENPRVRKALATLARDAKGLDEALSYAAEQALVSCACGDVGSSGLYVTRLLALPVLVRRCAVARWWQRLNGQTLLRAHVDAVESLLGGAGSQSLDLPGGRLWREYGVLAAEGSRSLAEGSRSLAEEIRSIGRIRLIEPGDRMRPARLKGRSRKLSDLLVDGKVPRRARSSTRVAVSPTGEILWAEHVGFAHGVEVLRPRLTPPAQPATNKS